MISERESAASDVAVVFAGDYLNQLSGEQIERECKRKLLDGCSRLVLNFSRTEVVNSIGISILLGVIDSAENAGTEVVFSEVKEDTAELFETLGISRHVTIQS